jgi:hypothetical protein
VLTAAAVAERLGTATASRLRDEVSRMPAYS